MVQFSMLQLHDCNHNRARLASGQGSGLEMRLVATMAAALLSGVLGQAAQPEQGGRWPFAPLGRVVPPEVTQTNWVSNPVDAFILSKLEANGIAPARLAKRSFNYPRRASEARRTRP